MKRWTVGIDPGAKGGMALLNGAGRLLEAVPMPLTEGGEVDGSAFGEKLAEWDIRGRSEVVVAIERVHSMPRQGVASTFKFGKAYGIPLGVIAYQRLSLERVTPQAWKKTFDLIGEPKKASREKATSLWDDYYWPLAKHEGMAEAALIAEHQRRLDQC